MITTEALQAAARAAHSHLPDTHGFILLVMPYSDGTSDSKAQYASNLNREDALAVLKTVLFRWGVNDEWMQSIK
jgi:hypothetical protein